MWPPMWTRTAARGECASALATKSSKLMQRSSRLQSTNATRPPARWIASGVAMKVFEGQSTGSPCDPGELERRQRAARPAAEGDRAELVVGRPLGLEALGHRPLGPALGRDHLVPEAMQRRQVTTVEADRELGVVWTGPHAQRV